MWLRILAVGALVLGCGSAFAGPKRDCDAAMRLKPADEDYLLARGICHLNNGDADLAIGDFDRFIELRPHWVGGYFNRGNAHFAKGAYDLAITDFSEALRHRPNDPDGIIWNRGNAYAEKRDYARAIENYDDAIRMKPNVADLYRIRAEVYEKRGDWAKAEADYTKALRLDPANLAAGNGLRQLEIAPPVPSPETASRLMIRKPRYGDYRLDWCRYWARGCGKPAADEFCRRHGYAEASSFAPDPRAGQSEPTTVIGTGTLCKDKTCNGFATIACRK